MSNHSGSYILNDVLRLLENRGFFEKLTPEEIEAFFLEIVKIGNNCDCNQGEILEEIGERMGICYSFLRVSESLEYGLCSSCSS